MGNFLPDRHERLISIDYLLEALEGKKQWNNNIKMTHLLG
jgi:hypothetical protein